MFQVLFPALDGAALEDKISSCSSVPAAWDVIQQWWLLPQGGNTRVAVARAELVQMHDGEDPKHHPARVTRLADTLLRVHEISRPDKIAPVCNRATALLSHTT